MLKSRQYKCKNNGKTITVPALVSLQNIPHYILKEIERTSVHKAQYLIDDLDNKDYTYIVFEDKNNDQRKITFNLE